MLSLLYVFAFMAICTNASPMHLVPRALSPFGPTAVSTTAQQQASTSARSSLTAGPLGYSATSSYRQSSSSRFSTSVVSQSFFGIESQIAAIQSSFQSQAFSQQLASQSISQLSSAFGHALDQAVMCQQCMESASFQLATFRAFSQLAGLIGSIQSRFGLEQCSQILSPFSPYVVSFQSFFQKIKSSQTSWNTLVPPQFPGLLRSIPGFQSFPGF